MKQVFSFVGRINRTQFLISQLAIMALMALWVAFVTIALSIRDGSETILIVIGIVPLYVSQLSFVGRRLHDLNHSGWWVLYHPASTIGAMSGLPILGVINLLASIYLLFWPGSKYENRFGLPEDSTKSSSGTVPRIIKTQLELAGNDTSIFAVDKFALGYAFGMANMAYFQSGGVLENQTIALQYTLSIFDELFGEDASALLDKAIQIQETNEFEQGRDLGSSEYGGWLKTNGKVKPLGLVSHFLV
jgi:uncharacterized membrane protein YhaH (DUF805 family)